MLERRCVLLILLLKILLDSGGHFAARNSILHVLNYDRNDIRVNVEEDLKRLPQVYIDMKLESRPAPHVRSRLLSFARYWG